MVSCFHVCRGGIPFLRSSFVSYIVLLLLYIILIVVGGIVFLEIEGAPEREKCLEVDRNIRELKEAAEKQREQEEALLGRKRKREQLLRLYDGAGGDFFESADRAERKRRQTDGYEKIESCENFDECFFLTMGSPEMHPNFDFEFQLSSSPEDTFEFRFLFFEFIFLEVNDQGQTSALTIRVNDESFMMNLFDLPVDTYDVLSRWKISQRAGTDDNYIVSLSVDGQEKFTRSFSGELDILSLGPRAIEMPNQNMEFKIFNYNVINQDMPESVIEAENATDPFSPHNTDRLEFSQTFRDTQKNYSGPSILDAQVAEVYTTSFIFQITQMSLRFRPSDNRRRDIVLAVGDINTDWFNRVLLKNQVLNSSDFNVNEIKLIPDTTINSIVELDFMINYQFKRNISLYEYKSIDSMDKNIFSTVVDELNNQRKNDTGIPVKALNETVTRFTELQDTATDFGKIADLTSNFINYTDTYLQKSEEELKSFFREIFHTDDETARYRLETDFMLLQEKTKNNALELWIEMLKFKTEREELADEEVILDKQKDLASGNFDLLKNLALGDSQTEEDAESSSSPLPKQPKPPHPTVKKLLPKLKNHKKTRTSVNMTEALENLNCTSEDIDECLENISCPSIFGTYVNAIFFASQVATTVGYGSTFPVSDNGKIFVSVFILISVPITALGMAMYAQLFNEKLGALRKKIFGKKPSRAVRVGSIFLYLAISIVILGLIQLAIFYDIEGWDMVTSIYFIVVTLTTIGYGDYEPTFQKPKHIDTENLPQPTIIPEFMFQPEFLKIYRSLIVVWMFFGIAWLGAIFTMIVEELISLADNFTIESEELKYEPNIFAEFDEIENDEDIDEKIQQIEN